MKYPWSICAALLLGSSLPVVAQVPLSERAFQDSGASKGTVILQVNWGRYWKCGQYVRPSFEPYVVLLDPGEYALSAFKMKIAKSVSEVSIADVDSSKLIVDGKPVGGSFTVAAGETVYRFAFGCSAGDRRDLCGEC